LRENKRGLRKIDAAGERCGDRFEKTLWQKSIPRFCGGGQAVLWNSVVLCTDLRNHILNGHNDGLDEINELHDEIGHCKYAPFLYF
jgi:hypothetical protein